MLGRIFFATAVLCAVWISPALASTYNYTYNYVGGTFTSMTTTCTGECAPFFPGNNITATIDTTWDTPYPSGTFNVTSVFMGSAGWAEGTLTLTDGVVTSWLLSGQTNFTRASASVASSPEGDFVSFRILFRTLQGDSETTIVGSGPAGTWTGGPAVLQTPLPAALPLFAAGLSVLGLLAWRRKRTSQP